MERVLMWLVVAASAVGGALADTHATGWRGADLVFAGAVAGLASLGGAYARRWTWLVAAGVAVVAAEGGFAMACAAAAVVVGLVAVTVDVRSRAMGALALALTAQALLRLPSFVILGAPSVVAVLALVPCAFSAYRYAPRRTRRLARRYVKYALGATIVIVGLAALAAVLARSRVDEGIDHARAGFDAIGNGDRDVAVAELQKAADAFDDAAGIAGGWWTFPVRAMPIAGPQLAAVKAMAEEGRDLSSTGAGAAAAIDYEELRVRGGAIDLGLIARAAPAIDSTAKALAVARQHLDDVTRTWLLPPIREKFDLLVREVANALPAAEIANDVVDAAPTLLGADGPKRYLVLLGSPAELRELGGFVSNFAEVTADHGKLSLTRSGRALEISDASGSHGFSLRDGDYQAPFAPYRVTRFFGNVSASANFTDVADVATQLYAQAAGEDVDAVFYMDPYALAALLELTGPITLKDGDVKLTSKNAAQELLVNQYTTFPDKGERLDFLDEATRVAFEKLTGGDLPKPSRVATTMSPMVDQGHLFGHSDDPKVSALFGALALDGDVPKTDGGDLLWVTGSNENPSKIDAYLQRTVSYAAEVRPDTGRVDARLTITLKNTAPADGLPEDVIGNANQQPFGTNHTFVTVYSPLHATSAAIDGKPTGIAATSRFGLSAFTIISDVGPGQTVVVELGLSGTIEPSSDYRLTVVRQPTVNPDSVEVVIAGRSGWTVAGNSGKATIGPDRVTQVRANFDGP